MTKNTRATGWVVGTVVLVLAIFAATWFLLAGPRFEAAALTMVEVETTVTRNDLLAAQNAQLRSDFESLDQYKSEVAALQTQIPADEQLAAYLRTLDGIATTQQVFLSDFAPGVPLAFVPVAPALAPAAAPTGELETEEDVAAAAEQDGTLDDLAAPAPVTAAGPQAPEGMVSIPFTMTVTGPYANGISFLQAVQTGTERLMLVTKVDGFRQEEQEATDSRPAVALGDVQFLVSGYLYVLPSAPVPPTAPVEEPAPQPLPNSDRNPFAPLG